MIINKLVEEIMEINELIEQMKRIAKQHYGGHYTVLSFTTNIKFSFGTITERDEIEELSGYDTLEDAVRNGIQEHYTFINSQPQPEKIKPVNCYPYNSKI